MPRRETVIERIQRERRCSVAEAQAYLVVLAAHRAQAAAVAARTVDPGRQWTFDTNARRWVKT